MPASLKKWSSSLRGVAARFAAPSTSAPDHRFSDADIGRLHATLVAAADGDDAAAAVSAAAVDEATWQGMLLGPYFSQVSAGASIFGKQRLYSDLRQGLDDADRTALVARLLVLQEAPAAAVLESVLQPLRQADTELTALLLTEPLPMVPAWAGACWLLMAALLLSVAAVAWSPLAWLPAFFVLFQMVALQARYHRIIDLWDRRLASLQMLLRCCSLAGKAGAAHPALAPLLPLAQQAGRINRALGSPLGASMSLIKPYLDWFLQRNVEHYFSAVRVLGQQRAFLQQCFYACARLDADIALARHRAASATCWATRGDGVRFDTVVHPLLAAPSALSVDLRGGAFISGQNGVGKSTLLRTVGLNLLTARAFGFCYAREAGCPMSPVMASMQSEDSLVGGASLYVAELARARALLDRAAGHGEGTIFIIDEIFRGTNHLESVSSAAAVLDELAARHLVLVSSHNLVLARLLEHRLAPLCVGRDADGVLGVTAGVLQTTNGISLLAQHGFSPAIDAKARRVFAWLETFLAQPPGGATVLAPTPALATVPARAA